MYIKLMDGTQLTHLGASGSTKYIQGYNRDVITFEFDESYSVDELRNKFTEANCSTIDIVTDEPEYDEEGNTTGTTVETHNYHEGYIIRVEVSEKLKEIPGATVSSEPTSVTRVYVSMAQQTYIEAKIAALEATVASLS